MMGDALGVDIGVGVGVAVGVAVVPELGLWLALGGGLVTNATVLLVAAWATLLVTSSVNEANSAAAIR